MSWDSIKEYPFSEAVLGSDGNHSARIWRISENLMEYADQDIGDDRVFHLISRVGIFYRGLAKDCRTGYASVEQVAMLLDQLADLGDLGFERLMR